MVKHDKYRRKFEKSIYFGDPQFRRQMRNKERRRVRPSSGRSLR